MVFTSTTERLAAAPIRSAYCDTKDTLGHLKVNTALSLARRSHVIDRRSVAPCLRQIVRRRVLSFRNRRRRRLESEQGECQGACPVLAQSRGQNKSCGF